jgi:hypothetical protein
MDAMTVSPLFAFGPARAGPAVRRGLLVSIPVGLALLLELGIGGPTKGAIAIGIAGAAFLLWPNPQRPASALA